jgi:hypothetical protein
MADFLAHSMKSLKQEFAKRRCNAVRQWVAGACQGARLTPFQRTNRKTVRPTWRLSFSHAEAD